MRVYLIIVINILIFNICCPNQMFLVSTYCEVTNKQNSIKWERKYFFLKLNEVIFRTQIAVAIIAIDYIDSLKPQSHI